MWRLELLLSSVAYVTGSLQGLFYSMGAGHIMQCLV